MKTSLSVYIWDNDGKTADRYTIAIDHPEESTIQIYGCSTMPFHPQGIAQFFPSIEREEFTAANMKHLGKRLNYTALTPDIQGYIRLLIWQTGQALAKATKQED